MMIYDVSPILQHDLMPFWDDCPYWTTVLWCQLRSLEVARMCARVQYQWVGGVQISCCGMRLRPRNVVNDPHAYYISCNISINLQKNITIVIHIQVLRYYLQPTHEYDKSLSTQRKSHIQFYDISWYLLMLTLPNSWSLCKCLFIIDTWITWLISLNLPRQVGKNIFESLRLDRFWSSHEVMLWSTIIFGRNSSSRNKLHSPRPWATSKKKCSSWVQEASLLCSSFGGLSYGWFQQ